MADKKERKMTNENCLCTRTSSPDFDADLPDEKTGFPWPLDKAVSFNLLLENAHRAGQEQLNRRGTDCNSEDPEFGPLKWRNECKISVQILTPMSTVKEDTNTTTGRSHLQSTFLYRIRSLYF